MRLSQKTRGEGAAALGVGHLQPLHVVTVERTHRNKPDVMLLAADDDQQLFFGHVLDLVDTLALADAANFCPFEWSAVNE